MGRSYLRVTLVLLVLACSAHAAFGDLRKLDPRARTALARLRAGATPEQMLKSRMAVNRAGELDVFIRGQMSRQELEAAGGAGGGGRGGGGGGAGGADPGGGGRGGGGG